MWKYFKTIRLGWGNVKKRKEKKKERRARVKSRNMRKIDSRIGMKGKINTERKRKEEGMIVKSDASEVKKEIMKKRKERKGWSN